MLTKLFYANCIRVFFVFQLKSEIVLYLISLLNTEINVLTAVIISLPGGNSFWVKKMWSPNSPNSTSYYFQFLQPLKCFETLLCRIIWSSALKVFLIKKKKNHWEVCWTRHECNGGGFEIYADCHLHQLFKKIRKK